MMDERGCEVDEEAMPEDEGAMDQRRNTQTRSKKEKQEVADEQTIDSFKRVLTKKSGSRKFDVFACGFDPQGLYAKARPEVPSCHLPLPFRKRRVLPAWNNS